MDSLADPGRAGTARPFAPLTSSSYPQHPFERLAMGTSMPASRSLSAGNRADQASEPVLGWGSAYGHRLLGLPLVRQK
jgi:hypothetical protein